MSSENCLVYRSDVFFKMCSEEIFLKWYISGIAPWRSWDTFCAIWNYRRKIFWVKKKSIDSHRKTWMATSFLNGKHLLFQATRKIICEIWPRVWQPEESRGMGSSCSALGQLWPCHCRLQQPYTSCEKKQGDLKDQTQSEMVPAGQIRVASNSE